MTMRLGEAPPGFRSGFASIVGRPNVGKSTLLNQVLRTKVAITSERPQTTRNAIRGVMTTDGAQIVFVDTPGLHKPRTTLGQRLNAVVRRTLTEVDAILFLLEASQPIGRGDAFIARELSAVSTPVVAVLNKTDLVERERVDAQVEVVRHLGTFAVIVPVSARTGAGVGELTSRVSALMPEGPLYYPPDAVTDQPERVLVAELIREKALQLTREEVPHSVAVVVEEMEPRDGVLEIEARVFVERDSQKGILIGKGGRTLKEIGTRARKEIEALLGVHVFLHVHVKVEPDWQRRTGMIERFGYGT